MRRARPSVHILWRPEARGGLDLAVLARTLSGSPLWGDNPATLIVRPPPQPLLGAIGSFDDVVRARLEALAFQLRHARIRYVGYRRAEEDCVTLAARLQERWSLEDLRRFSYLAIPRGGLLVLGMLAYVLDLPAPALAGPGPPGAPLVIVDDCALSGARFASVLRRHPDRAVIFAHLYSHPDLRSAVAASGDGVVACVAAHDLHDEGPEIFAEDYGTWHRQWAARSEAKLWIGKTDHLCFAWSEPDFSIWNPATEEVERGWRLVPGEACLKNRMAPGDRRVPVQVQPIGKGPLAPPPEVVFGTLAGQMVVGHAGTGEAVALDDVGGEMWTAIVAEGTEAAAAAVLAAAYEVTPDTLRSDLDCFVREATVRGLLTLRPGA